MSTTTTTVWIVRHGETSYNVQRIIQGHIDIPLNEEGLAQAIVLAKFLKTEIKFDLAYSSDLDRAKKTAETVLEYQDEPVCKLILDERIRERHLGEFQGHRWGDNFDKNTIEQSEPFDSRLLSFWDSIFPSSSPSTSSTTTSTTTNKKDINILIASHGGSIRALIAALLKREEYKLNLTGSDEIINMGNTRRVENCSITKIVMNNIIEDVKIGELKWIGEITSFACSNHFVDSSRVPSPTNNADVVE